MLFDSIKPLVMFIISLFFEDKTATMSCLQVGYSFGSIPSVLLHYNAPSEVFYTNVDTYSFNVEVAPVPS